MPKGKVGKKKLNIKQRKFVKEVIKTGDVQQATLNSGYLNPKHGYRLWQNGTVQEAIHKACARHGLTIDHNIKVLKEATGAKKIHGTSDDFIEIEDHGTRVRAVETFFKLIGVLNTQKGIEQNTNIQQNTQIVIQGKEPLDLLQDLNERLKNDGVVA